MFKSHYFGIVADKSFQKADWRIRPLNKEMMIYAVSDTRYLIRLTYELLVDLNNHCNTTDQNANNIFIEIQQICKALSLSKYEKPKIFSKAYSKLVEQVQQRYNSLQLQALQIIWVY